MPDNAAVGGYAEFKAICVLAEIDLEAEAHIKVAGRESERRIKSYVPSMHIALADIAISREKASGIETFDLNAKTEYRR